ncbi:hypothetical protein DFJ73DRAFT_784848 [Zopfochytrium polystomum]|nr:hypothetical protein DFJ73DRAFT_784848 [Zopfochytrium polystomum]
MLRGGGKLYCVPIGIHLGFGAALGLGVLLVPESPRWFVRNGKDEDALKSLAFLNSTDVDCAHCSRSGGSRKMALRTWTGICLQALQQLTGVKFIMYYGTTYSKCLWPPPAAHLFRVGMLIAQFIVAGTAAGIGNNVGQDSLVAFVCICIFFWRRRGPRSRGSSSEIYPLEVCAKALSMPAASSWALSFVIWYATP